MTCRLLTNNWYSFNINGGKYCFFKSRRGIKQEDPLSPSLVIICAELLSRLMEQLKDKSLIPYTVNGGCPIITQLSYVDATILFSFGDPLSLISMMVKLAPYGDCSGQLVNKSKSCFLQAPNSPQAVNDDITHLTSFSHF